jgi:AI-2 transport protein TqsA
MADEPDRGLLLLRAFFAFIAAVFLIYILKELRQIFIPFCIALLLYFMLNDMVHQLERWKIPKALSLIGVLLVIFVCLYLFGLLFFTGVSSFIDNFPAYSEKISGMIKNMMVHLKLPIIDVQKYMTHIDWDKTFNPGQVTALVSGTMGSFTSFIGDLLLVLLLLMFMLGEKVPMAVRIARSLSPERGKELTSIVCSIDKRVQHYLFIKTLISLATAALAALILIVGRVDFIIFSALLVFFLNYIPTFGSLISTIFPIVITFIKYGFCLRLILVAAGLMVMQFIMGNVLEPQIMGKSMNLSPIVILLSLIFWGWMWGVVGMFLAVPITSALKIIFESIPAFQPLAAAMSGE